MTSISSKTRSFFRAVLSWFDNSFAGQGSEEGVDWARVASFVFLHLGCLGILWVGWSWTAVAIAFGLYVVRAFFITAFYHRYFSHRTFKTSRPAQFVFAVLGNSAAQRGPLWWAAHHRQHHRSADHEGDPHSPVQDTFYWSHMGWITARENFATRAELVRDLTKYPELRWLDRFDAVVPAALAAGLYGLGALLAWQAPGLGTNGPQMLVWGFFVSTVVLFHVTCLVNSVAHKFGRRPYPTRDHSRNNWLVALLTLGEGWHNNHHYYPVAARQGFRWWEIDVTYYALKILAWMRVIWDMNPVPARVFDPAAVRARAAGEAASGV